MSEQPNNDELAAFVTSTLNAIVGGVEGASSKTKRFAAPYKINFEVAVKAVKSKEGGGGLRIQVFNAEAKASSEHEAISKISFEVHTHNMKQS
ncbi:MAG: trypco2 family protein [Sphingopyxis sp.]